MKSIGNHRMIANNKNLLYPWREEIAKRAEEARPDDWPLDASYGVKAVFLFNRPRYHYDIKGNVKKSSPQDFRGRPDLDKLSRALLDAISLTQAVMKDDSQVIKLMAQKRYCTDDQPEGCICVIEVLRT